MRRALALLVCLLWACSGGSSAPREQYNEALAAMDRGDLDEAAEALLEARDQAGSDGELRYSAAYNLGLVHARRADAAEGDEAALEALRTSAAWFRDAVRLRGEDEDARANLEIVLERIQIVADRLNRGKNGLEARLTRLIADQRDLRDGVRELWTAVDEAGASATPTGFADAFAALATRERALYAEIGAAADLAADELALLDGKAPEELSDQDKVRQIQLGALGVYLQEARVAVDDGRRALRRLSAEESHEDATEALAALVRAREQLLDPVEVLRSAARDEMLLWQHTTALERLGKDELSLDGEPAAAAEAPSWLSGAHLAARQRDVRERAAEVAARFRAAAEGGAASADPEPADPQAARAIEAAAEAVPALDRALAAMDAAATALDAELVASAGERETEALRELAAAIERFSGLRAVIELAHAEQRGVVQLLDPEAGGASEMSASERAGALGEAAARNVDRLERLEGLLRDERAAAEAELGQAAAAQGQGGAAAAPDPEAAQAIAARFDAAERHRSAALEATRSLAAIAERVRGGGGGEEALELARSGQAEIEELRRLFFSIVEHLKDLLRQQGETHDRTAEAQPLAGDEMLALLGPAADSQREHAAMADALAQALAEQADAAAQAPQGQAQGPGPDALAQAAAEVRAAAAAMHGAAATLESAREDAARMSVDLSPALEDQPTAMAHIEEAIRLLQPPQQNQDQQQQNQEQDQQQQEQQQQQLSRDQAQRRLQAIREREAQRRRERRQPPAPQPVEKDW